MKKTLRPILLYYSFPIITLPILYWLFFSALTVTILVLRVMAGIFALGLLVWQIRDFRLRLLLKIEVENQKIYVPSYAESLYWPIDLQGNLVRLSGFEDFSNETQPPFFDGKSKFIIPFENITGVWFFKDLHTQEFLVIGTDFYDFRLLIKHFSKKQMKKFFAENIPSRCLEINARYQSVVYQVHKETMKQLMEDKPEETTWLGKRKLIANEQWIEYTSGKKSYRIWWKDVKYCNNFYNEMVIWGKGIRLTLPMKLFQENQVFLYVLTDRVYEGKIEPKLDILQNFLWNKGS